jgi:prevent-host-death family protein
MDEIGAFEAKNTFGTLLERVERGEEIVITRYGRAVARLVPNTKGIDQNQSLATLERIRQRALRLQRTKRSDIEWPELKKIRDQGRS